MIEREGHEHFTLPEEHEWRRRFILTEYDKVLGLLTRTADEVRRMRNEVYTHDIDPGRLETPYSDWVGRLVSTVVQNHGNLGIYLSKMVDVAAGVDMVLEDERRAGHDDRHDLETLRRLVNDLRKRPTSRPARDQLFGELNRQLTRDSRKS